MHQRNKHGGRYDFDRLTAESPELKDHIIQNKVGQPSIDFSKPSSVLALNRALLISFYGISNWEIPEGYLCPPIPGRADYIHHMADVLQSNNYGRLPVGDRITCLDVGVGASCIYPLIGHMEYGWSFIGSDIDEKALDSAQKILDNNPKIKPRVKLKLQPNKKDILYGILRKEGYVDMSICNPPFHSSAEEARSGSLRKVRNLGSGKVKTPVLNFGGQSNELWCEGGERKFIHTLIRESRKFKTNCFWFSTLVSKQTHLKSVYAALKEAEAVKVLTIPMGQGNKTSRIVAWTFLTKVEQRTWKDFRWNKK